MYTDWRILTLVRGYWAKDVPSAMSQFLSVFNVLKTLVVDIHLVFGRCYCSLAAAKTVEYASGTLAVREITKSNSTFSATNISSNMIWFFQLRDTIKMKSDHTAINYDHNNIDIRSHIMIYNNV